MIALPDGSLAAHWLIKNGTRSFYYDVTISHSFDGGKTWGKPFVLHRDGGKTVTRIRLARLPRSSSWSGFVEDEERQVTLAEIQVNSSGHSTWATFKYTIAADVKERHVKSGGRGMAILQHGPNGWQFVHWHTSSPRRPNEASPEKKN